MYQTRRDTGFLEMSVNDSASETDTVNILVVCRQYVSEYECKPLTGNKPESDYNI